MSEYDATLIAHAPDNIRHLVEKEVMRLRLCRLYGHIDGLSNYLNTSIPEYDMTSLLDSLQRVRQLPFDRWNRILTHAFERELNLLNRSEEDYTDLIWRMEGSLIELLASDREYYDESTYIRQILYYLQSI